ncbi:ubiquitin carboxyl-terminal hydrolase 34, partial [Brachionus plicatilis]
MEKGKKIRVRYFYALFKKHNQFWGVMTNFFQDENECIIKKNQSEKNKLKKKKEVGYSINSALKAKMFYDCVLTVNGTEWLSPALTYLSLNSKSRFETFIEGLLVYNIGGVSYFSFKIDRTAEFWITSNLLILVSEREFSLEFQRSLSSSIIEEKREVILFHRLIIVFFVTGLILFHRLIIVFFCDLTVNTYFSFPLELNMSGYMEENLIESGPKVCGDSGHAFVYDLIGVTVHTGTADGGHYYSFIQETGPAAPKWFCFNDAEVKQFDAATQLSAECFGGETTSKTYDCHSDKFTDLSFEKTNSAYMLFYKKRGGGRSHETAAAAARCNDRSLLCQIWHDNLRFVTDRLLFDTAYFDFVHELCQLSVTGPALRLRGGQLAITFFLQTLVHSREKHRML